MALIPTLLDETVKIGQDTAQTVEIQTSKTYKVDWNSRRVVGYTDGRDALEQAIYKILRTERFAFLIYSWNYGFEMGRLLGQSEPVVRAEVQQLITEALTEDDRISAIEDFSITFLGKRLAQICFTAVSIFGDIDITTEVSRINV